jgi:hypothetical protein
LHAWQIARGVLESVINQALRHWRRVSLAWNHRITSGIIPTIEPWLQHIVPRRTLRLDELDIAEMSLLRNALTLLRRTTGKPSNKTRIANTHMRGCKTKSHARRHGFLFKNYAGDHLISHTVTRAVPSAQRGLTSVFGMGTGDPSQYGHRQSV